jgi:hypothetical protein
MKKAKQSKITKKTKVAEEHKWERFETSPTQLVYL